MRLDGLVSSHLLRRLVSLREDPSFQSPKAKAFDDSQRRKERDEPITNGEGINVVDIDASSISLTIDHH